MGKTRQKNCRQKDSKQEDGEDGFSLHFSVFNFSVFFPGRLGLGKSSDGKK